MTDDLDRSGSGRLLGKTAIVTGGGNGIGAACARRFAWEGAAVTLFDSSVEAAKAVADEICASGGSALAVVGDVAEEPDWSKVVAEATSAFGPVNVLVNNAGILPTTPLEDIGVEEWDRVLAVNLRGAFLGTKAVVPHMKQARSGAILNISSLASILGISFAHYSASKAGLLGLTRVTAVRYGPHGIRANAIIPGSIATDMMRVVDDVPAIGQMIKDCTPLRRIGAPQELASAALFLVSDEAGFVTGSQLVVDGGYSLTNGGTGFDDFHE
jgi:cyclopentanol dehydrogenase